MANINNVNTLTKVPCGGFMLGEGLALGEDGKTLNVTGGGGGGSVPKPLTYDYMPDGYPKKSGFDIEWDGNTDGLTSAIYDSNVSFYKVSDIVPTNDELSGGTFSLSDSDEVIPITSDIISTPSEDLRTVTEYIIIVQKENATLGNALFPQTGTYFYKGINTGAYVTRLSKQIITPMAEEFLPSEVNELIMNSSTANSTKKFKITVDDSGKISATEVTA